MAMPLVLRSQTVGAALTKDMSNGAGAGCIWLFTEQALEEHTYNKLLALPCLGSALGHLCFCGLRESKIYRQFGLFRLYRLECAIYSDWSQRCNQTDLLHPKIPVRCGFGGRQERDHPPQLGVRRGKQRLAARWAGRKTPATCFPDPLLSAIFPLACMEAAGTVISTDSKLYCVVGAARMFGGMMMPARSRDYA